MFATARLVTSKGAERVYDSLRDYLEIRGSNDTSRRPLYGGKGLLHRLLHPGPGGEVRRGSLRSPNHRRHHELDPPASRLVRRTASHSWQRRPATGHTARSRSASIPAAWRGCDRALRSVEEALRKTDVPVGIKRVACGLMCEQAPAIEIEIPGGRRGLLERHRHGR